MYEKGEGGGDFSDGIDLNLRVWGGGSSSDGLFCNCYWCMLMYSVELFIIKGNSV